MGYFVLKALISGLLVAAASEIARRHAGFGALIASLPLAIFFQLSTPFPAVQARAYAAALVLTVIILAVSALAQWSLRHLGRNVIR